MFIDASEICEACLEVGQQIFCKGMDGPHANFDTCSLINRSVVLFWILAGSPSFSACFVFPSISYLRLLPESLYPQR